MIANTAETLSRGMAILTEKMGIVEAETFLFLVKNKKAVSEGLFDKFNKKDKYLYDQEKAEEIISDIFNIVNNTPLNLDGVIPYKLNDKDAKSYSKRLDCRWKIRTQSSFY